MQVGLSEVDITPPVGISLIGYSFDRKSIDIHDRLCAQTVLLDGGETKVAIVTCDLIALPPETVAHVKQLVTQTLAIPPQNLFIHATHTHTGPATVSAFGVEKDDGYLEYLPRLIAGGVTAAYHNRQPARIGFGTGREEGVSFNRRYLMKDGKVRTNPGRGDQVEEGHSKGNPDIVKPTGPIDPEVGLMKVEDETGQVRGLLVNFCCHDDTVGGDLISADYPGVIRKVVRAVKGRDVVASFMNGPSGNINHVNFQSWNVKEGYFAHTEWMGTILAAEAIKTAEKIECCLTEELKVASTILTIPIRKPGDDELAFARNLVELEPEGLKEEDRKELQRRINAFGDDVAWAKELVHVSDLEYECEVVSVGAVRIGDAAFVFLPGEPFVEFGLRIKDASSFQPTFIVELTNSGLGYVPTMQAFREGTGYEERLARSSRLIPEAGDMLAEAAIKMLETL